MLMSSSSIAYADLGLKNISSNHRCSFQCPSPPTPCLRTAQEFGTALTRNRGSGTSSGILPQKFVNLTFFEFGLPEPLLIKSLHA